MKYNTYWLESSHLHITVVIEILLRIVDCHSSIDTVRQRCVLHDRYTLIGAISMFEKHDSGPVVGKVFGESTCCAAALCTDIASHIWIEGVPADNLMEMGGRGFARLNKRVEALDGKS